MGDEARRRRARKQSDVPRAKARGAARQFPGSEWSLVRSVRALFHAYQAIGTLFLFAKRKRPCAFTAARTDGVRQSGTRRTNKTARGGCSLCRSRATKNKTVKGTAYQSSERPVRRSFFDFAMLPVAASRRKRKAGNRFCWHACFDTSLRRRPGAVRHIPAAQAAKEPLRYWP